MGDLSNTEPCINLGDVGNTMSDESVENNDSSLPKKKKLRKRKIDPILQSSDSDSNDARNNDKIKRFKLDESKHDKSSESISDNSICQNQLQNESVYQKYQKQFWSTLSDEGLNIFNI